MRGLRLFPLLARLLTLLLLVAAGASIAQNPSFPTTPPDDPLYPPESSSKGPSGQWDLFGFIPPGNTVNHPSGISADEAWKTTIGRPDVIVAVLDSGVDYDHEDLRRQIWLNSAELPEPQTADGSFTLGRYDLNGDGVFDVEDYIDDPRVTDLNNSGVVDRGDLEVFADGIDNNLNGYVDDLSGWDSDDEDGDEFDHRFFGHGTGRNGFIAAATNNSTGMAGICPRCRLMNVRIDDTFVHSSEGLAKGVLFAVDNGATVLNMALGGTTASRFSRSVFDYATRKNALALNAMANEFSFHHNFQTVFDEVMGIGAVVPDNTQATTTYLQKASFSNYGAHLDVVAPSEALTTKQAEDDHRFPVHNQYGESSGTSSAVPHAAGVAALIYARAKDLQDAGVLDKEISAQEVRQVLRMSADDIVPGDTTYPVSVGWDKWTGYGRINAKRAVEMVTHDTLPPEADINSPDWYTSVDGVAAVAFYANARWQPSFDYVLEIGAGVEPSSFTPLATGIAIPSSPDLSSANLVDNFQVSWDTSTLTNGAYTLRLTVTDSFGNKGEDRLQVWVQQPDPDWHPGWPLRLDGSIESSPVLVDLDGDNLLEIILATGNGAVFAFKESGEILPGFPVHTDTNGIHLDHTGAFDGDPGNGEVTPSFASLASSTAVGDIDRDGLQEIVVGAMDGKVYVWKADGTPQPGFPVSTDIGVTVDPYTQTLSPTSRGESIIAAPALGDLDNDGTLEIIVGAYDQKLYAWHADGTRVLGFPVPLFDPEQVLGIDPVAPNPIVAAAALADIDNDGFLDVVVGTTEVYRNPAPPGEEGGSGRMYALDHSGQILPGWPVKPLSLFPDSVPLVATGVGTAPAIADVDGDRTLEVANGIFFSPAVIYNHDGSIFAVMRGAPFGTTGEGGDSNEETPEGGAPRKKDAPSHFSGSIGAFSDLNGDGSLEYLVGTLGNGIAPFAVSSGVRVTFDHLFSAWNAQSGRYLPHFPRVIEDWQFLMNNITVDIDGDGQKEVLTSSGGYYVHAWNAWGEEPSGWPKFTGNWVIATPAAGDIDGDGLLEIVAATRLGYVYVWDTPAPAYPNADWWRFHHDEWNTGFFGADTRPPATIGDLQASTQSGQVTLTWTAVGDDGLCGKAAGYEIRAASFPIDRTTFDQATEVSHSLVPQESGSLESITISPLPGVRFFAVRVQDEQRNVSAVASAAL